LDEIALIAAGILCGAWDQTSAGDRAAMALGLPIGPDSIIGPPKSYSSPDACQLQLWRWCSRCWSARASRRWSGD